MTETHKSRCFCVLGAYNFVERELTFFIMFYSWKLSAQIIRYEKEMYRGGDDGQLGLMRSRGEKGK